MSHSVVPFSARGLKGRNYSSKQLFTVARPSFVMNPWLDSDCLVGREAVGFWTIFGHGAAREGGGFSGGSQTLLGFSSYLVGYNHGYKGTNSSHPQLQPCLPPTYSVG